MNLARCFRLFQYFHCRPLVTAASFSSSANLRIRYHKCSHTLHNVLPLLLVIRVLIETLVPQQVCLHGGLRVQPDPISTLQICVRCACAMWLSIAGV